MSFIKFGQISKLVLNVKYLLWLSYLTAAKFYDLDSRYYKGALTQKEIILSELDFFQI